MPVKLNSSGGGSVTLDVPATATATSLTVPASNGTIVVADNSGNVTYSGTTTFSGNATFNAGLIPSSSFLRNRIINGDMRIDQRNAGASVTINAAANTYTIDRWLGGGQTTDGVFTVQRSAIAPTGFSNSALITVTTADASIGATQAYYFRQPIEGFNTADFGWGAAGAQSVTLSFWVRSSVTGTFGGAINNSAFNRSYPFSFTVNSANTFEQKSVTISGDTTGTWLTDNGIGLAVTFSLGMGSTYKGTAGSWSGSLLLASSGAVDLIGTNGATFYLTGVQLEVGSAATPFERRQFGQELLLCQRYYQKTFPLGTVPASNLGTAGAVFGSSSVTNTSFSVTRSFLVQMRASPTMVFFSPNQAGSSWSEQSGLVPTLTDLGAIDSSISLRATGSISAGGAHSLHFTASAEL